MSNLRRSLQRALSLNEAHVDASRSAEVTLSTEEASLLETLRSNPGFEGYPKDQLDRHTIKHLLVSTTDNPVSVCERAARKAEILMARGALNENLEAANGAKTLCEADVPEEKPLAPEGEGDLPQGDADSTSGEHDGEDHENPGKEDSEADDDGTKQGGERGDQSDTAEKGYKDEKKESKDVEHGHDEDDAFQLENDDEEDVAETDVDLAPASAEDEFRKPKKESKKRRKVKEQDAEMDAEPAPPVAENDDEDADDLEEEGAEGSQNDAKDPAPEEDRAASDAKYKDGAKQNEAEDTTDVKDHPDLEDVEKEDPANSELDKGPADPKLESLTAIEARICNILSEAGIKKGSQRWTEAYLRGWNLAMEHRAKKLGG